MHLVSFEQIAVEAGVSARTIARDVKRGKLRSYKVDGKALIDAGAAREYIADKHEARAASAASQ
jgi:hypothetical protein